MGQCWSVTQPPGRSSRKSRGARRRGGRRIITVFPAPRPSNRNGLRQSRASSSKERQENDYKLCNCLGNGTKSQLTHLAGHLDEPYLASGLLKRDRNGTAGTSS